MSETKFPKISIVTPSYNQGPYLEETILSVLGQGYPNLEYIIIDGGSTDNSVEIIKKYEKQLAFWCSEKDKGMYDAIQKGFSRSTGEIMGWINSDDKHHSKSYFVLAQIFNDFPEIEWLQGNQSCMDEQGRIVSAYTTRKWSKYDFLRKDYKYIQQESTFWRRSLWERAGASLRTDLKYAGDFELWLRFFDHARLYNVLTILGCFRFRTGNQFSLDRINEYHAEAEKEIDKRLSKLSDQEKDDLAFLMTPYSFFDRFGSARMRKQIRKDEILNHTPWIVFDRLNQSFIFAPISKKF